ncbi:MAG: hypothetical protein GY847_16470 [Proteobacteria bacterium]|nr:hypothetical protein [Pseudomonadota bacterium]
MNNLIATFQSESSLTVKKVVLAFVFFGAVIFLADVIYMKSTLFSTLKLVFIVEVITFPFLLLAYWISNINMKVSVFKGGIRAPSDFKTLPVKSVFIKWGDIKNITVVEIGRQEFNNLESVDGREIFVSTRLRNSEEFYKIIGGFAEQYEELKKIKS